MLEVGALSLEALSRGAKKAYLCDNSKEAIKIIKMNIEKTRTTNSTSIYNLNYEKALLKFKEEKIKFNIVFLDPPYESNFAEDAIKKIIEYSLLSDNGKIIVETDNIEKFVKNINDSIIDIYDIRKYGRVNLLFLKPKDNLLNN